MRTLLALVLLVCNAVAHSQTIVTLQGESCSSLFCWDIPNDGDVTVDYLQVSCGAGCVAVSVNGIRYSSGLYATDNLPHDSVISFSDVPLFADDGTEIFVSAHIGYSTRELNAGRAHYWLKIYTLLDGTLTIPDSPPISQTPTCRRLTKLERRACGLNAGPISRR